MTIFAYDDGQNGPHMDKNKRLNIATPRSSLIFIKFCMDDFFIKPHHQKKVEQIEEG